MYIDYNTKFKLTFYEILYFHLYTHLQDGSLYQYNFSLFADLLKVI